MDGFRDNPVKLRNVGFAIRDVFCAWMVKEQEHLYMPLRIPSDWPNPCLRS